MEGSCRNSGEFFLIFDPKISSALLTVCEGMWLTNNSVDLRDWPSRGKSSRNGAFVLFLILFPTTWPLTIPGCSNTEYFIHGDAGDLHRDPASFFEAGGKVFACGKDPYFPAWPDVVQLNAFHQGLRKAIIETVNGIADQCDGVRCDMAMLMLNDVFARTWEHRAGARPREDYWTTLIPAVRARHPGFLFLAEAYWDLEWELQRQGFDFCYDKRLYDRLEHENAESVRLHLCADVAYQKKLVRFIENHDEPRAASILSPEKERATAITTSTLQGTKLFHEGQLKDEK
jgi:hypothetical protein